MNITFGSAQENAYAEALASLPASARAILELLRRNCSTVPQIAFMLEPVRLNGSEVASLLQYLIAAGLVSVDLRGSPSEPAAGLEYRRIPASTARPKSVQPRPTLTGIESQIAELQAEADVLRAKCRQWEEFDKALDDRLGRLFQIVPSAEAVWHRI
jgi:hypothetical protein